MNDMSIYITPKGARKTYPPTAWTENYSEVFWFP